MLQLADNNTWMNSDPRRKTNQCCLLNPFTTRFKK